MTIQKNMREFFKRSVQLSIAVTFIIPVKAQQNNSSLLKGNRQDTIIIDQKNAGRKTSAGKAFIVPAAMFVYGLTATFSDPLKDADEYLQRKIWVDNTHQPWHGDDYLQYAPAAAVYVLNIAGIKGKNNFRDRTLIFLMSNIFHTATTTLLKDITRQQRPDGSSSKSFPSGHTAEAFASAEFLREEYKEVSPWYGIAGYTAATTTGMLRMYNNRHWLSDVIAGAGIGIASTKLAYLIYPSIKKWLFKNNTPHAFIIPYYQNASAGLLFTYSFYH